MFGADELDRPYTATSVDFSTSISNRFRDANQGRPQTVPYYSPETDQKHWARKDYSFQKDCKKAGRTEKTAWWDHAQFNMYSSKLMDKVYNFFVLVCGCL